MLRRRLLATSLTWPVCAIAGQGRLEWLAGDLPPFAWQTEAGPRGFAHELALAMAERLERPQAVTYYPWARAVRVTEQGDHYGIFPLARTPDRETRFRWLIPLLTVRYAFVSLATSKLLDLSELRERRIGVLRGSPIINNLKAERFRKVIESKDYRDLLRMLQTGTIHAIYAGAPMLDAAIEEYGHPRGQFTTHTTLGEATLYMATSLALPAEEGKLWLKAYQALEDDGTVARLRRRYIR